MEVILFGGATGTSDNFTLCNDAYCYSQSDKTWYKVKSLTSAPVARAAHAACSDMENSLFILGGATKSGVLAQDSLYRMFYKSNYTCEWTVETICGAGPGKRYGHAMVFRKNSIFVIGGNLEKGLTNDIHVLNLKDTALTWVRMQIEGLCPSARIYHSAAICNYGRAARMIIIYGGRDAYNKPLNDTWGLRQHSNGSWDWVDL